MDERNLDEWQMRAKSVIIEVLGLGMKPQELADGLSLYSSELQMDSMTLLQILVAFEGEFEIEIDDEDVMNADLDTVASLIRLVLQEADHGLEV